MLTEEDFNFDDFASKPTFKEQNNYARARLKKLGSGSARVAYLYQGFALKIAKNKKGLAQNIAEGKARFQGLEMFAQVFKRAQKGEWLLMELCEKATQTRVKKVLGVKWTDTDDIKTKALVRRTDLGELSWDEEERYSYMQPPFWQRYENVAFRLTAVRGIMDAFRTKTGFNRQIMPEYYGSLYRLVGALCGKKDSLTGQPFADTVDRLVGVSDDLMWLISQLKEWEEKYHPNRGEIDDLSGRSSYRNWGITTSRDKRRVVAIDFGLNDSVWAKHYC